MERVRQVEDRSVEDRSVEDPNVDAEESVLAQVDVWKEQLRSLNTRVTGYIKQHPAQTLLGALALGYLVGRIARGGRHGDQ